MDFKAGMVVQLNSGGEKMTVVGIIGDKENPTNMDEKYLTNIQKQEIGDVLCQWFDKKKLEQAFFKKVMIQEIK